MTSKDICARAAQWESYKYWYGAKGQLATVVLAKVLKAESPSVWTSSYYTKALKDVDGKTHVGDCSGLVCHAYNISEISSYGIKDKYKVWTGDIKDGMILWRKGHVGLYDSGKVREMKGIDYDYQFNVYVPSQWSAVLYDPAVDYSKHDYETGWHQEPSGKWWYAYGTTKGSYYHDCLKEINGAVYAFDSDGYMIEGAIQCQTDENGEVSVVK